MRRNVTGLAALAILATTQSLHAQCKGDLNNDQTVDVQDLLTLLVHFGECCKILITSYPQLHLSEIHYTPNSAQGNDTILGLGFFTIARNLDSL
jgi:hypothetical protein